MTRAFVFPGQGSQAVGMGKALAEAFPAARASSTKSTRRCSRSFGPDVRRAGGGAHLDRQCAAGADGTSLAALRVLEARPGSISPSDAAFVAGHSLGEYSALCAAGALSIADAARLLRLRGAAMQQAVPVGDGAMAALLGLDLEARSRSPPRRGEARRRRGLRRSPTTMAAARW